MTDKENTAIHFVNEQALEALLNLLANEPDATARKKLIHRIDQIRNRQREEAAANLQDHTGFLVDLSSSLAVVIAERSSADSDSDISQILQELRDLVGQIDDLVHSEISDPDGI